MNSVAVMSRPLKNTSSVFYKLRENDVYVHPDSKIGEFTSIGQGTNINGPAYIASSKKASVTIGKYCAIAYNLRIRPRNHFPGYVNLQDKFQNRFKFPSLDLIKGPVVIGNNVWIGDNVTLLSGVTIGDGAIIGAGAIVTKVIPSYSVAAGNPAKVIKRRFSEHIISQLSRINWWDWPEDKILRNRRFFEIDFSLNPDLDLQNVIVP